MREMENTMLRNSNQTIKALLLLSALLLSASAQPQTITGKVVGVSDGDTLPRTTINQREETREEGTEGGEMTEQYTLGKDLQPGDRVISDDGQVLTIRRLSNGIYRGSRIAEYERGKEWTSVFDRTRYQTVESSTLKKGAK
jgi:hypothetical protein